MVSPASVTQPFRASSPRAASFVVLLMAVSGSADQLTSPAPAAAQPASRHRLQALRTRLLSNYSGHFAPYVQVREDVPIKVSFNLLAILELDAAKQVRAQSVVYTFFFLCVPP